MEEYSCILSETIELFGEQTVDTKDFFMYNILDEFDLF